jgi:putative membrane protein
VESTPSGGEENMSRPRFEEPTHRFDVKADATTHFAWLRTRMAAERTLMAWVRTSVSLIGFGFTIFQFFSRLSTMANVAQASEPHLARYVSLALIGAGTLGLGIALFEYQWLLRYLWGPDFRPVAGVTRDRWNTPVFAVTIFLMLIGLAAFVSVYLRVT